jgi:molybdopterin molybdotransferase
MITVAEADKLISERMKKFVAVYSPISDVQGKILQEDICADRDAPPFHRVAMDGIAIDFSAWQSGQREFHIERIQKAGEAPHILIDNKSCLEVMTGAVLPIGTNCVIKVEDIKVENKRAIINDGLALTLMQNIHQMASDHKEGTVLVKSGDMLLGPQVAVAASVGKASILVSEVPSIAIISTGDELVEVDQEVKPYQIRMSNSYALQASLKNSGFLKTAIFHIIDDQEELFRKLSEILLNFDVLILSGGVSMGKFDYIPSVLNDLGVSKVFHKINQKPGKPFWFGISKENKPVFALPGNPVSTLICFRRYILPNLFRSLGADNQDDFAILAEDVNFKANLTWFLPVKLKNEMGIIKAYPVWFNGSGDYASLVNSDGFVELAADQSSFPLGTVAPVYRWNN